MLQGNRSIEIPPELEPDGFYDPGSGAPLYRSAFSIGWFATFGLVPQVILDIGSYDGGDGVRFKQAFPASRVISFEADPDRFKTVSRAAEFGVEPIQCAVSSTDGEADWYGTKDRLIGEEGAGSQGSLYRQNDVLNRKFTFVEQTTNPITVRTTRLDTFCRTHGVVAIDLAHVDVQGAEYDVLAGLGSVRPALLYIEVEQDDGAGWVGAKGTREVHALCLSLGYALAGDFVTDRLYVHGGVLRR